MLRGVVFDMDGVIIDSHPAHRMAWKAFLASVGRTTTEAELDFILEGHKREEILKYFLGELDPGKISEYGRRKDELLRNQENKLQPILGVVEFLDRLADAGVRIAVATCASRQRASGTLAELGLAHHFEAVISGDDVKAGKPDPAIYHLAAARMGEVPQNLLAVEDAVSGVQAAHGAGMRCLGVAPGKRAERLRQAGARPIIEDFRSLSLTHLTNYFR